MTPEDHHDEAMRELLESGMKLHRAGDLAGAERAYRQILERQPHNPDALHLLGLIAHQCGRSRDAIALMERALSLRPASPQICSNLGEAYRVSGLLYHAEQVLRQALRLEPDLPQALTNLALVHEKQNRLSDAIQCLLHSLELGPQRADVRVHLARVQLATGRADDALREARQVLTADLQNSAAAIMAGAALEALGRPAEAESAFRQAMHLEPTSFEVWTNLGNALRAQGRLTEALDAHRRALDLAPTNAAVHSNLLLTFISIEEDPQVVLHEHEDFARRHGSMRPMGTPRTGSAPQRRLRVGYVSPDFRAHALSFFLEPLLQAHDHEQVEVFCYSDVAAPDETTARLRGYADHWRDVAALAHEQLAAQIAADSIDILIDLAVHTSHNRLPCFALKPAPVQGTYLGYCGTTGLPQVDFRITDAALDPPERAVAVGTERPARLADCFCCYRPPQDAPEVAALPALGNGFVTFGSFNTLAKVTASMLDCWAAILRRVPRSRLRIQSVGAQEPAVRQRHLAEFERRGVEAARIVMAPREPFTAYLRSMSATDIALDTYPFNGHTTSCHQLWMGAAMVTLAGTLPLSRVGASVLRALELPELVAPTPDEYVEIAVKLADDIQRLNALRDSMRAGMQRSPLLDAGRLARQVEQVFRSLWREWCARA